jgi:tetratricopeptide (TPR) repeat protein
MRLINNQRIYNTMNKLILILLLSVFSFGLGISQSIDEEIEFKYIKAKYLLDTERYEDAIKEFTDIIKQDKSYNNAIIQRAKAKYAMAAYKGTKRDVLLFAESSGMNADALTLLGKADYRMGNSAAAINSLLIASQVIDDDPQIFEFLGNMYEEEGKIDEACAVWRKAAKMGSSKARINAKKACGDIEEKVKKTRVKRSKSKMDGSTLPTKTKVEKPTSSEEPDEMDSEEEDTRTEEQKRRDADDSLNSPTEDKSKVEGNNNGSDEETTEDEPEMEDTAREDEVVENEENMPRADNTPNEIEIDEDLILIIRGQGLGKRKVLDQPNILILSDEDGTVSIDICVNKRGKVESAEFNSKLSTIAKKSLVSLAIRKSKDFWFEKNDYKEQCGVIMFKIKGS